MKVALFTDTYPPFINGVSTSCFNLVKTLKEHGHDVVVVTTRNDKGKLEYSDGIIKMPGVPLGFMYDYRLTRMYNAKVVHMLKKFGVEIIHNQTDLGVGQFAKRAAKKLHVPLVYTYHTAYEDYTHYMVHGLMDRVGRKILKSYTKSVAKNATEFITPSVKTKEYMRNIASDAYVNVVPSGIDFSIFKEEVDEQRAKEFKEAHGIGPNTKVVLLLGRVATEKSMDFSIKGFAAYLNKHPDADVKMLVVGDGPQRSEYELLSHELHISNKVDFSGKVPALEVPFYYHLADVYTSASLTETQGLTFMEAMSAGTIVLARFDSQLADTIIDNKTGFFFTDEDSLLAKLEKVLSLSDEERQRIISGAYEIVDMYSLDKFYDNIMEVYNRALKKYW